MPLIDPALGIKIILALGITNLAFLILVRLSCRCLAQRFAKYTRFYKLHCLFWWGLIASVTIHAIIALLVFVIPV